tara:strand:+ start:3154 stop:3705 length:552 start_codon:yes stop_codon:yes gene_type:complete
VNIFVLDENPQVAAQMMCDKHVVKMIVESGQMLSTAHRVLDGTEWTDYSKNGRRIKRWKSPYKLMEDILYKASFVGHPCTKWVMENNKNYYWLVEHAYELCREYTRRYGKVHKTDDMLSLIRYRKPINIPIADSITPFAQAMPDEYKNEDAVKAYRAYYLGEKTGFAEWKNVETPSWYKEALV